MTETTYWNDFRSWPMRSSSLRPRPASTHVNPEEIPGDDIGGIAVHIGARVSALSGPNDVLVSSTLRSVVGRIARLAAR
jgi:hypothetical protein